jgi:autotransporter family porin
LPSVQSFVSGHLVSVINAGTIDLTNGPPAATDRLTIFGNYFGQGGRLLLNTVLAGDGAPSNKLVISGGQGTGTTSIGIINLGGTGALTVADGILVVEAVNGGTTAPGAFQLGGPVAAGAYEYLLFRGGVTGGTQDNWYLRSSLVPGSDPPVAPLGPILPPPPAPPPGSPPIPLFRPEVAVYSALPPLARELALATLGTYHERAGGQNDRRPPAGERELPQGAWSRTLGGSVERSWAGVVSPSFDGTYAGFQAGQDLLQQKSASGHRDDAGLYVGFAQTRGDVRGFAVGRQDTPVGSASLEGTSLGAYWTHIGPMRWYVDAVMQATVFDGSAHSIRGVGFSPDGYGLAASLEGGFPIPLAYGLTLEPQAQAVWQHISLNDARDRFSTVAFDADSRFTGRVGARLYVPFASQGLMWRPYLKANVWHTFAGDDRAIFAQTDVIGTQVRATALELGGGGTLQLSKRTSIWGDISYLTDVGGTEQRGVAGSLGFRWAW